VLIAARRAVSSGELGAIEKWCTIPSCLFVCKLCIVDFWIEFILWFRFFFVLFALSALDFRSSFFCFIVHKHITFSLHAFSFTPALLSGPLPLPSPALRWFIRLLVLATVATESETLDCRGVGASASASAAYSNKTALDLLGLSRSVLGALPHSHTVRLAISQLVSRSVGH
jgi:hypothetical protein